MNSECGIKFVTQVISAMRIRTSFYIPNSAFRIPNLAIHPPEMTIRPQKAPGTNFCDIVSSEVKNNENP